jgi:hypothetical protein
MSKREITKLIKKFGGWWEGDIARFPSPHLKDEFLKALKELGA